MFGWVGGGALGINKYRKQEKTEIKLKDSCSA